MAGEKLQLAASTVSTDDPDLSRAAERRNRQAFFANRAKRMREIEWEHFGKDIGALAFFGNNINDYLPVNQPPAQSDNISEDSLNSAPQPE